ncbi:MULTISPECIES: hypothetical protein [Rhodopseudomonas]|nr:MULTISPECIES: hypothetical protein [Rhodopseudomonas]MDF3813510.1 hypothetical protein [Rhodopseudomonas sp. BAL398]WOK15361.1 hypothetical protein RBJ75_14265 [Rhodopseudomonas sp. BAL398]
MAADKKDPEIRSSTDILLSRMAHYEFVIAAQTAALLVLSLISAVGVFLTRTQIWAIATNTTSMASLLGGIAVLFFAGLYLMQRAAGRRTRAESQILYLRNAADLSEMKAALASDRTKRTGTEADAHPDIR